MKPNHINLMSTNHPPTCGPRNTGRSGFTLIEILIVVAVMAILMSLVAVAVMSGLNAAKVAATKATIVKVQGLLQARLDAIISKGPDKTLVATLTPKFGNAKLAEAMALKFTVRQNFPQTWEELTAYYPQLLILSSETAPAANATREANSAEVLYFLLVKANVPGYPPVGDDVFDSSMVKDTDGNGKMEFVDAWNKPLQFYRWPTRLVRGGPYAMGGFTPSASARAMMPSLPTTATDLTHDPDDKFGFLRVDSSRIALTAAEAGHFEQGGAPSGRLQGMGPFHTANTFSIPLIVSGGADLFTGLYLPGDTTNFGFLAAVDPAQIPSTYDNITNLNIRSGGN